MKALARLDAVAQAELVRRGELAPHEPARAAVERIEALDPLLRAVVTLDADRADPKRVPAADAPLRGVPFLVKDDTPYPGLRWSIGSRLFRAGMPAPPTPFSERVDAAGLVTLGKSACSEMGLLGSTETLLEGVTHNPWSLAVSAAGSSGGAAAAVAAGLVPFAHAQDGGGSIRIPASVCGLFGFKPSRGRTASGELAPSDFGALLSNHCVSRSVRDSALFLSLLDVGEPRIAPVTAPLSRRLRVGAWTQTSTGEEPTPEVRAAFERTVSLLEGLGHRVERVAAPPGDGLAVGEAFFTMAGAMLVGMLDFVATMRGAPVATDELEPFTWGVVEAFRARGPAAAAAAREVFEAASRRYLACIAPFDVVLTPVLAGPPWPLGHLSPVLPWATLFERTARAVGYTPIHNVAGCPAMSVPLSWSDDGLPLGSHFAAAPGRDALLLELALELEEARPWRDRWAPWSYPALFDPSCPKS